MITASRRHFWRNTLVAAAMAVWTGGIADAQAQTPAPEDFMGLDQNRGKPLEIEGELAEPEANGVERYSGNASWVLVRLGSTALESHFVTVYYERSQATAGIPTAELRKAGLAHILKLEASGDVVLTYQDQTVAGYKVTFDIAANKVLFNGPVTFTRMQKVTKGAWLSANITTGNYAIAAPLNEHHRSTSQKWLYETWGQPKPKHGR
jgi:lipopolysaccharide export system protein LptA